MTSLAAGDGYEAWYQGKYHPVTISRVAGELVHIIWEGDTTKDEIWTHYVQPRPAAPSASVDMSKINAFISGVEVDQYARDKFLALEPQFQEIVADVGPLANETSSPTALLLARMKWAQAPREYSTNATVLPSREPAVFMYTKSNQAASPPEESSAKRLASWLTKTVDTKLLSFQSGTPFESRYSKSAQPATPATPAKPTTRNEPDQASEAKAVVGWFRNDLRLRDNPMLHEVCKRAEEKQLPSMLIYILDPRFYDKSDYGRVTDQRLPGKSAALRGDSFASRKCNGRRARFYLNVLRDLSRGLGELGTELKVFYGKPEDVFANLSNQHGALDVVCLREPVSPEWTDVERYSRRALKKSGGSLTTLWGAMSWYHEDDTPFSFKEAPTSYTALAKAFGWKDIWTTLDQYRYAAPIQEPLPKLEQWAPKVLSPEGAWSTEVLDSDADALQTLGFSPQEIEETLSAPHGGSRKGKGGETAAWLRFDAWMAIDAKPTEDDPNFVTLGGEYGAAGAKFVKVGEVDPFQWKNLSTSAGWTQISKYMACGCITAREMYHALAAVNHWALPGLVHRLMWREWHRINAIKFQTHLFRLEGPGGQKLFPRFGNSECAVRWKEGKTGIPYVDACMRELNKTGWLPYHKRKTVACFLAHDLKVDWRMGGFHFEEVLLDYDVAMNYGNWTFCARVDKHYKDKYAAAGFRDPDHNAILGSIRANSANDPEGSYVRAWVPELKNVPKDKLQFPWLMTSQEMQEAQCAIGKDYPEPLVEILKGKQSEPETAMQVVVQKIWQLPGMRQLDTLFRFPAVGMCFLTIVYFSGLINSTNNLAKQLCIVCSHNVAIGYYFDRDPEGIYVGFPHFGPLSTDIPVLRVLARFWSYEMVAIRAATALRPWFIPGLFASFMSLIIPQMAVFAPWQLGGFLSTDYFKNPISFASVNGFPALIWLIYMLGRQLSALPVKSMSDLATVWVDNGPVNMDYFGIAGFLFPFAATLAYKMASDRNYKYTPPAKLPGNGLTYFILHALFVPCYVYLYCSGWLLADVHKVVWACASLIPIWWVNCLGGVDLWIEEPMGMPAREIAFTPTWIVSHGVFMLQWALDPNDYINRLCYIFYFMPQMVYLNYYFRLALRQDYGTQLPIYYSYLIFFHMTAVEVVQWGWDISSVGLYEIARVVVKDCPLHFTPTQFTVVIVILTIGFLSPSRTVKWALYSSCGPLNWLGVI